MYERTYGAKYDRSLRGPDIAKRIRQDIKSAIQTDELPAGVYSVRYRSASMCQAIDVTAKHLPGVAVLNPERIAFDALPWEEQRHRRTPDIHNETGARIIETLNRIHAAYNHDGSERQVDYFDVNYYGHVSFEGEFTRAERDRLNAGQPADATDEYKPEKRTPAKPKPSTRDFLPDATIIPLAPIEVYGKPYSVEKVENGPKRGPAYVLTSKRGAKIALRAATNNPAAFWTSNLDYAKSSNPLGCCWLYLVDGVLTDDRPARRQAGT